MKAFYWIALFLMTVILVSVLIPHAHMSGYWAFGCIATLMVLLYVVLGRYEDK